MILRLELRLTVPILIMLCFASAQPANAAQPPNIYVIVVDGLGSRLGSPPEMPELWRRLRDQARGRFYRHGLACMPTVTNTNHVSIATGVYAAAHGITGDSFWERRTSQPAQMDKPSLIEVDTIFSRLNDVPGRVSAALFGKSKLARLFAGVGERTAPTTVWGDLESETLLAGGPLKPGSDARTMDQVIKSIADKNPEYVLVNLGDVDRFSHSFGPDSTQARDAIADVDRQLARLFDFLKSRASWNSTVVFVTADHGIESTQATIDARSPTIDFEQDLRGRGIRSLAVITDGGVASIYTENE